MLTAARLCRTWFAAVIAAVLLAATAWAAPETEGAAEIRVGARSLFFLTGSVGSVSAEERARLANRRIEQILHDPALDPQSIEARTLADGSPGVALGGLPIVEVSYADAEAAREAPERVAEKWATALRSSLTQLKPVYSQQRRTISVKTLSEHHVLLLIVQVAALLMVARLCGEVALRLGQPPVIGQLLAGVLLGQSFLGAFLPDLKALIFPVEATQSYLLEVVSWLGVLFLLMLTGMETDLALIRQQGRPLLWVSLTGILLPFALGAGFGWLLPARLLTTPESRLVLALFLGTLLSVSSVPVIAKILLDMRLLRRNVGQMILASALVHDTVGWILLAVVASLASSGEVEPLTLGKTLLGTVLFGAFAATLGRPLVRRTLRWANNRLRVDNALLTAVVVLMLISAAITQFLGVHAVLGAFAVGILLREVPVVNERVLHPIEAVTTAIFAPIFFAAAGLYVNLGVLANPSLLGMAVVFIALASIGKIAGCYAGARWGGAPHWDALSVGFGTNARGAMGLIVGILGFSLGILTVDLFSLIIVMAVVTTAMTPSLLRWSLRHVSPNAAEESRLREETLRERSFLGAVRRVLLPTRGGEDARLAACLVDAVARQQPVEITGLYVRMAPNDVHDEAALDTVRRAFRSPQAEFHRETVAPVPVSQAVAEEAARGYQLVALGCAPDTGGQDSVFGRVVDAVAREVPLPLMVVRAPKRGGLERIERVLVPTSGALLSVQAAELAVAVARAHAATVTALHVYEPYDEALFWLGDEEERSEGAGRDALEQVRSLGEACGVNVEARLTRADQAGPEIIRVAAEIGADLIVMGGGVRHGRRLFLGRSISTVVRGAECAVAVLRP